MNHELELILLRHAHAEPAGPGQDDRGRPLSARGEIEAEQAARWLKQHPRPQRVLHSPALRTRQTAERTLQSMGDVDMREEAGIYEALPRDLFDVIERHREAGCLMLVGHNPGLESLVALLATGQSGDHRGMPPAGIARLVLPIDAPIEPGVARLVEFWSP